MAAFIGVVLTAVDWRNEGPEDSAPPVPQLRVVGVDDLEREVVEEITPPPAPVVTFPIVINVNDIREYYARRHGKVGTRITFRGGAARPVKETFEEVRNKIVQATVQALWS